MAVSANIGHHPHPNISAAAVLIHDVTSDVATIIDPSLQTISRLFDNIDYRDTGIPDYTIYFNMAACDADTDTGDIQFIYIGDNKKEHKLLISIGKMFGDNLHISHAGIVAKPGNGQHHQQWINGGEFSPVVDAKDATSAQNTTTTPSFIKLDEHTFLLRSLDYISRFEQVGVYELKDDSNA